MKNYKIGYTHAGFFHYDDVLSAAFLKRVFKGIKIVRVNEVTDEMRNDDNAIIFDIGFGEFDHHQDSVELDAFGNKMCAFGLLWEKFGLEYLENLGFRCAKTCFSSFKYYYVRHINLGDNFGYKKFNPIVEEQVIKKMNARWYQLEDPDASNKAFEKAVVCADMFLDDYLNYVKETVDLLTPTKHIWKDGKKILNEKAIILDYDIEWSKFAYNDKDLVLIIVKDENMNYKLMYKNGAAIKTNDYIDAVINFGKTAICYTEENAIKAAEILIQNYSIKKSKKAA